MAKRRSSRKSDRPHARGRQLQRLRRDFLDAIQEDFVFCLECGRACIQLGAHLNPAHGMTAAEYKKRWGYNMTTPLVSKRRLAAMAVHGKRMIDEVIGRERHMKHLKRITKLAHQAEKVSERRPEVVSRLRDIAASRRSFDAKSAARLYRRGLTPSEIARRLGASRPTIWRYLVSAGLHTPTSRRPPKPCATDGCERPAIARGLCRNCYQRDCRRRLRESAISTR